MYFDIYKTSSSYPQKYWWVAKGGNNETLCSSEMLSTKAACINAISVIKRDARTAPVYDETGEKAGDVNARRISV